MTVKAAVKRGPWGLHQWPSVSRLAIGHNGHDGQSQNEKRQCQNRHYNINILFIYSEQMTESDIDFDQNDHDHFDYVEPVQQ